MDMEEARGLAAQCWCDPETSSKTMDPVLAEAFARRLVQISEEPAVIRLARQAIAQAFAADPDFRRCYVDNVAMLLHDHYGITDYETRNKAGDDIVRLIFESA